MSQVVIDDTDSSISYHGVWYQITAPSGGSTYQNSVTSTNYEGSQAQYSFQGNSTLTKFHGHLQVAHLGGFLSIYSVVSSCDDNAQATARFTIDVDGTTSDVSLACSSATRYNQLVYSGNNPQGNHRLTITYRGGGHPFSLDRLVYTQGGGGGGNGGDGGNPPASVPASVPTPGSSSNPSPAPTASNPPPVLGADSSSGTTSATTTALPRGAGISSSFDDVTTGAAVPSHSLDSLTTGTTTRWIGQPFHTSTDTSGVSSDSVPSVPNDVVRDAGSRIPLGPVLGALIAFLSVMGLVIIGFLIRRQRRRNGLLGAHDNAQNVKPCSGTASGESMNGSAARPSRLGLQARDRRGADEADRNPEIPRPFVLSSSASGSSLASTPHESMFACEPRRQTLNAEKPRRFVGPRTYEDEEAIPLYQSPRDSTLSRGYPPAASPSLEAGTAGPSSPTAQTDLSLVYTDCVPPSPLHSTPPQLRSPSRAVDGTAQSNGNSSPTLNQRQLHHLSDPPEYEEVPGGGPGDGGGVYGTTFAADDKSQTMMHDADV